VKISKYLNISIFVLLLVSLFLVIPIKVEAVATTRTVCPDPVGDCSPSDPLFKGAGGIILAIAASADGDTVSIKNGTYSGFTQDVDGTGKYFIILTKNISITGESTSGTILSGAGTDKGTMLLIKNTGDSSISNLSITGGQKDCPGTPCSNGSGILVSNTGTGYLTLTNLKVYDNPSTGIWVYGNSKVNITNSTIFSNSYGIAFDENSLANITNNTIRNNTLDGVSIDGTVVAVVNNNQIYSNTNVGLRLWTTSQTTGTGNTIHSNLYIGHASGVFCSESAVLGTWANNNVWNNANGNYGSDPVGLCTDKTGSNGNISVDPQSLLNPAPTLPDTAMGDNSFLKIILSFLAICIGITFLSRHFDTIRKEDN